jgi:demethylmenaquinone methyltransferase/2-methoxy-6-polyprenyl-1,4-benzoquinol methylase
MTTQWTNDLLRDPHHVADKRTRVQRMFAAIAPSYDINNRLHSLWMDQHWRKKAVTLAKLNPNDVIVDVACGTGDLTFAFANQLRTLNAPETFAIGQLIGLDFTYEMLPIARAKASAYPWSQIRPVSLKNPVFVNPARMSRSVLLINGDALSLPFPDACCDVVSIAFGIRNVADPAAAIKEFRRVLRPGGRLIILEFSLPTNAVLRGLYNFYFRHILPRTATLISGDKTGAYKYLPESVNTFISRQHMTDMMSSAGFGEVTQHPLTFGVCVCYRGVRSV